MASEPAGLGRTTLTGGPPAGRTMVWLDKAKEPGPMPTGMLWSDMANDPGLACGPALSFVIFSRLFCESVGGLTIPSPNTGFSKATACSAVFSSSNNHIIQLVIITFISMYILINV